MRWKPPSFPMSLPTYPQFLFFPWDPDYGKTLDRVDMLLGGEVFSKEILHGRKFRPTRAPSAFKTCFAWVLNGEVKGKSRHATTHDCCATVGNKTGSDEKGSPGGRRKIKRIRKCEVFWPA